MTTLDGTYNFLSEEAGVAGEQIKPDTDLYADLRVDGDDFFGLTETFESRFSVDMSTNEIIWQTKWMALTREKENDHGGEYGQDR